MKYNINTIQNIMPGKWVLYNPYFLQIKMLSGGKEVRICYRVKDDFAEGWLYNFWFLEEDLKNYFTNDEKEVLLFYKKHFKFVNYK